MSRPATTLDALLIGLAFAAILAGAVLLRGVGM
jgi:hypothetical protein